MRFDVGILATTNLAVQLLLMLLVLGAAYLAKRKKAFGRHCAILRGAVALQIISILIVMLPSMLGYLKHEQKGIVFNAEILTHHTLGLAVIALWVYINLVQAGVIKRKGRLVVFMRLALGLWLLALLMGVYMFAQIYLRH